MAVYQIDKITEDVRIALDENKTTASLALLQDTETLALDELIQSKIVGAVQLIHMSAPLSLLDPGENFGTDLFWITGKTHGYIKLPDDFMRLMVFRMSDWERPVYEAIDENDPIALRMSSRFAGLRGTPQKPKCVFGTRSTGRVMEFYSCKNNTATVEQAVYMPHPKVEIIETQQGIRISKRCYQSVVYTICALVCSAFGEIERSKMYNELAQSLLQ